VSDGTETTDLDRDDLDATTVAEIGDLERLATEFADQLRLGRPVRFEDYIAQHPHLAAGIRELFPVIQAMEQHKQARETGVWKRFGLEIVCPEQLDDCRVVREIGRGGMGVVFEARREPSNERVAVKWLPWSAGPKSPEKERFEREAQTIGKLQHPNIVSMLGYGEDCGHSYFVMPYVEGVSLDHVIHRLRVREALRFDHEIARLHPKSSNSQPTNGTKLADLVELQEPDDNPDGASTTNRGLRRNSWKLFARIAMHVARALSHAHRQGILHNDIKPGNLLLDSAGRVWVTDFGVARPLDCDGEWREVSGTLRYMAPERFSGYFDELSDLYSLGLTLYELVTRQAAFDAQDRTELIKRIRKAKPVAPRRIDRRIPRSLEIIILRAIRPDPDERYYSVDAFAADLQRFVNGERIRAKRPTRWRLAWERFRRKWRR
jgi:serine/threonine protein kinase